MAPMNVELLDSRMARLEGTYEQIDKRLATVEGRFDGKINRLDGKTDEVRLRLDHPATVKQLV